jgi:hypothetical protein
MRKIKGYLPLCRLPSPSVLRTVASVLAGADWPKLYPAEVEHRGEAGMTGSSPLPPAVLFREQHRTARPILNHIPTGAAAERRSRINLNARPRGRRNNGRWPGVGRRLRRGGPRGTEDREAGGTDDRDPA